MPMQSRTDQVHSYEFFLQRVVSGLVARESDPAELPFRRLGWSGFGSVMIAIVVAAVFAIVGLIVGGGNDSWRDGDSIIVEKGTETIYVFIEPRLHPVANLVSAQLYTGGADVKRVSSRSLEDVPRGVTLGIRDAPQSLPGNGDLLTGAWTFCSQQRPNNTGGTETISVLGVGRAPEGGRSVGDRAVLVRDVSDEALYLVWRGYRFEIRSDQEQATVDALQIAVGQALRVSPAWVTSLPLGDSLAPPPAGEIGQATSAIDEDVLTGDVIQDRDRFWLVTDDRLVEMTALQAQIVLGLGGVQQRELRVPPEVPRTEIEASDAEGSPPRDPPEVMRADELSGSVCAQFAPADFSPEVLAGGRLDEATGNRTRGRTQDGSWLADYVVVDGGAAALVQSMSAPDAAGGPWHVVNAQGMRYPLPNLEVASAFGYEGDRTVRMFGGLVTLLPSGPALDPAVADDPVPLAAP
jgi:ESX secretion system ATPase EccB